jgi:hypothetical protein
LLPDGSESRFWLGYGYLLVDAWFAFHNAVGIRVYEMA